MNPQCCSIPRKAIKHSLITEALNKNRDIPAEDVFEQLCTISNLIPYYKPCHERSTHHENVYNVITDGDGQHLSHVATT